jgi:hypothetical protein
VGDGRETKSRFCRVIAAASFSSVAPRSFNAWPSRERALADSPRHRRGASREAPALPRSIAGAPAATPSATSQAPHLAPRTSAPSRACRCGTPPPAAKSIAHCCARRSASVRPPACPCCAYRFAHAVK